MRSRIVLGLVLAFSLLAIPNQAIASKRTVVGPENQRLTASQTTRLMDSQIVKISGTAYNKKVGIYLAFCEMPKPGSLPTNCAGGMDLSGESPSSFWISSNPPEYAVGLTKPFSSRGGFIVNLRVSRFIGKVDCALKKCAILTRADHTRSAYRKADVVIPVSFTK